MDPDDLARRREQLLARRAEIEALAAENDAARATVGLDQQSVGRLSRMDALQGQAMAQATRRRRQAELKRIETALRLIEEGEYGWCQACGEPIDPRRLDLDPTLQLCIDCAG
ncbi:MAG: TraR/DksA family transcriptional regulator [Pseudomonadota bacterium]